MPSADDIQSLLVHGLGIHRYPGHGIVPDHRKFFCRNAVRTPRLHCKLRKSVKTERILQRVKKAFQLIRFQCGWRSSADIDGIKDAALCFHHPGNRLNFLYKGVQIQIHTVLPLLQGIRTEGTVQADTGTKRNPHIKAVPVFIIDIFQDLPLPVGYGNGKGGLLRTYQISFPHFFRRFSILHSRFDHTHRQLGRPDPGKVSPGKRSSCEFHQKLIEGILYLVFIFFSYLMGILTAKKGIRRLPLYEFRADHTSALFTVVMDQTVLILFFYPEAKICAGSILFFVLIRDVDLAFRIKSTDQFINIMFKFSVQK